MTGVRMVLSSLRQVDITTRENVLLTSKSSSVKLEVVPDSANLYSYGSEQRVGRTILSLDSCAQQCDGYNSAPNDESGPCLGVLFYPQRDGGQCWLKFAIGNSLSSADLGQGGPVDAALWVDRPASSSTIAASSTNPASPTGTPCQNGTTYLSEAGHHYLEICGTYYYGTEPKADYADNIEQCAEMCDQYNSNKPQDLCIGAIFLADETICYLKTSLTGSVEVTSWATLILLDSSPASSTTASSAIPTSTRAPCVNGSIFTVPDGRRFQTLCHLDWNSDGIYYTFVDSLESCAAQCADYNTGGVEQPCVGVSFVPDRQGVNCYLKYGFDNLVLDWPFEVDSALLLPEDNGTSSSTTSSSTTSSLTSSPSSSPSPTTFSTIGCPSAVTLTQTAVTVTKPAVTVTVTVGC
ncbi:MAG: hypothetical protein M1812_000201 [Candelaria pacifica]|nr:MAG: hypothetical protein M1812_000201 [Candelaria pacifica]